MVRVFLSEDIVAFPVKNALCLFNKKNLKKYYLSQEEAVILNQALENNFASSTSLSFINKLAKFGIVSLGWKRRARTLDLTEPKSTPVNNFHTLFFVLTEDCNLSCPICFVDKREKYKSLKFEKAKEAIHFFIDCNSAKKHFCFSGGEPLLRFELLKKIVDYIEKLDIHEHSYLVATNGTILNEEVLDYSSKRNIEFSIGLDGFKHNHCQSKTVGKFAHYYDKIIVNIARLQKKGLEVGIVVTVGKHNILDLPKIVDFLINSLKITKISFNSIFYKNDGKNPFWIPLAEYFDKLVETREKLHAYGLSFDILDRHILPLTTEKVLSSYCLAHGEQLVVGARNVLGTCYGLFDKDSHIYSYEWQSSKVRIEYHDFPASNINKCQGCSYIGFCAGGCAYNRIMKTGSPWKPDENHCQLMSKILDWVLNRLNPY